MNRIILYIFLCVIATETQSDSPKTEDLIDEYYTTTNTTIDKITEQDDKYARAIVDSKKDAKVIASIFVYQQDKVRRRAISQEITDITHVIANKAEGRDERTKWKYYWISDQYMPQTDLFMDLCHSMIFDENAIMARYLENFFKWKDQTWITIALVLIKDLKNVVTYYETSYSINFKDSRKMQERPFEYLLRVWVREIRDPIEKDEIPPEIIKLNVDALKKAQDDDGWHENRDQLEKILLKKSIKFARLVIEGFEKANCGKSIEEILNKNVGEHDLNAQLAYAYASLARYIKDKHKYIAGLLDKYSDGSDSWAAWMICVAVVHPQEWPKIDEAFKKDHNGDSLSKFIVQKMSNTIVAEALAVLVDPKFKPTTFTKNLGEDESAKVTPAPS